MTKDINPLTERLQPFVAAIEAAAAIGDSHARQIIKLYQLHVKCPADPGAYGLCQAAFDQWLADHHPKTPEGRKILPPL